MASSRSKELQAKQKAERAEFRRRKRESDDPRDWSVIKQMREAWKLGRQFDKQLAPLVIGTFVGIIVLSLAIGLIIDATTDSKNNWIWGLITGIFLGSAVAMWIFGQRMQGVAYKRYDGQPGAGEVALQQLNKKKYQYSPAIFFNRERDCIHRVVGPMGVLLVGDGNPARLKSTLNNEAKRHQQVLYRVPVSTVQIGDGEGQVPLAKLNKHIEKMPKTIEKEQVAELGSKLKSLDAMRAKMPIPKGPMPTSNKGARKMMRGH